MSRSQILYRLRCDTTGSMVIETAIVAPVLILLALGTFEVSTIVARQNELQSAASEGEIIAMAAARGATTNTSTIRDIIKSSINLGSDNVQVTQYYRCDADTSFVYSVSSCGTSAVVSSYIKLQISDKYVPVWTNFGVGQPINFSVVRSVQLS